MLPRVRYIHSVATDSVLAQLERHGKPETPEVLIEVNVAGEAGKSGIGSCRAAGVPGALPGRRWSG